MYSVRRTYWIEPKSHPRIALATLGTIQMRRLSGSLKSRVYGVHNTMAPTPYSCKPACSVSMAQNFKNLRGSFAAFVHKMEVVWKRLVFLHMSPTRTHRSVNRMFRPCDNEPLPHVCSSAMHARAGRMRPNVWVIKIMFESYMKNKV